MPGLDGISNITYENVTQIANITDPTAFFINVNHVIFEGWLYFILIWVAWFILAKVHYDYTKSTGQDDILVSMFESGAIITLLALLLRGVEILNNGVVQGLLTDAQMWLFPLITVVLGLVIYSTKN